MAGPAPREPVAQASSLHLTAGGGKQAGSLRYIETGSATFVMKLVAGFAFLLAALPALAWEAKPLREIAVHPERRAQAQVVSLNESRLAAEISARIVELPLEPGQRIARGALLAKLDCNDYDLAAERARAALRASEAKASLAALQHERARKLAAENFVSREALDVRAAEQTASRAEVAVAAAGLKTAEANRGKCAVRAPFPAIVLERLAQVGEMAAPGTPLLTLLDTSRIEVRAEVQQADAAGLQRTGRAEFVGLSGRWPVKLKRLSPAVAKNTRLMEARLRFTGTAATPGGSGQIIWNSPEHHVPPQFVARRNGGLGVFLVEGNTPRFHALSEAQEGRPALAEGLNANSRIVVKGLGELR
ncbi:MAG: efflux RND transporter periplasmic adaptor subunit [Pseudomonadota bacterium]|nr:efflux RND transporter periplasmic adaptor subunit [Pseudomonadota bacterium]MDP1906121.1 efflux RND transporter periplasmic adaptor subunit [Pseudomonadota bacterium]MDP2352580.1 efflux RND transporter periplasmic adaptor subunit [Pseudomonadota bacterium]